MDYRGKIIVVTGAAHGLGKGVASAYAKAGARVILADIQQELQIPIVEFLRKSGLDAYAYKCDVSNDESVAAFAAQVESEVGTPDIIHNNAVFIRSASIFDLELESLRRQVEVNVFGYIRIIKAFLPKMVARGSGWIVNTASPNGLTPDPAVAVNLLPYCICKSADISLSQSLAVALKPHGIGVSVIFPDVTYTDTVHDLSGSSSAEFNQGFASFLKQNGKDADSEGQRIVNEVAKKKFFTSVLPKFGDILSEWAANGMDPLADYKLSLV
ncbi:hypothetical protein LB504_007315 [Fusarium proliferatum]|nr:hypothetical protein LB504_007315 [Fusarium proliferatum]